jgi:hypothetical protein
LQITRNVAGAAALLALAFVENTASAAEKLVGTYGEVRTILAFKVSDAELQKMLPDGWQVSPMNAGPEDELISLTSGRTMRPQHAQDCLAAQVFVMGGN